MEIHLPPEVEQMLHRQVASGRYASPTHALIQAIYLLDDLDDLWKQADPEKLENLRRSVQEALTGPFVPGDEAFARLRARSAATRRHKENPQA